MFYIPLQKVPKYTLKEQIILFIDQVQVFLIIQIFGVVDDKPIRVFRIRILESVILNRGFRIWEAN
jgi:hypothetical protein